MPRNLFLSVVGLFMAMSALAMAKTTYPYYQVRDLEQSILADMRELQATEKELLIEIGMIPVLVVAGEVAAWFKAIDQCRQPSEAASINSKIERVNYLQNAIPTLIGQLRALSPGDAAAFLKSRSYVSLQTAIQRLEATGGRRSPPSSCKPKQTKSPPPSRQACDCQPPTRYAPTRQGAQEEQAAVNAYSRCMQLCYNRGGLPGVPGVRQ